MVINPLDSSFVPILVISFTQTVLGMLICFKLDTSCCNMPTTSKAIATYWPNAFNSIYLNESKSYRARSTYLSTSFVLIQIQFQCYLPFQMSSTVNFYPFRYYYCLLILLTFFSACFLSDLFGFSSYLEDQGFFYTYFIFFSFLLAPSCSSSYAQFLELVFFCLFLSFYYLQPLLGFYYYLQTCFTFCLYRSSLIKALFFVYFGSPFSIFFYYSLGLLLSACSPFYWIGYVGQTMMILSCGLGCCLMNAFPSSQQTTSVPLVDSKFNISFFLVRSTTQTYCLVGQWSESQSCILGLQIQLI